MSDIPQSIHRSVLELIPLDPRLIEANARLRAARIERDNAVSAVQAGCSHEHVAHARLCGGSRFVCLTCGLHVDDYTTYGSVFHRPNFRAFELSPDEVSSRTQWGVR